MQKDNQNNLIRSNRFTAIRSKLKILPILHSTTDRINTLIIQQKGAEQNIQFPDTDSEEFEESDIKLKQKSVNTKDFEAKYTIGKKLGEGAHGYVKECFHKETGNIYALKIIPTDNQFFFYLKRNFVNIIELNHPNIIKYKAFYYDMIKEQCLLVMDYLPYPSLEQIEIENEEELKHIIFEVIQGLEYIHQRHICHRDIKPENILYDKQKKKAILIDFGCSCKCFERGTGKEMLTMTGTPYYRAPQMFTGGGYDQRIDLWSLGVLIYKLIEKITPFQSEYHSDTINNIIKGQFTFNQAKWDNYSHLAKDLVIHLLKPKNSRLTIKQTKNHFWFEKGKQNGDGQMIKSAGFDSYFVLKRAVTQFRNSTLIRAKNHPFSPNLGAISTPKMFNLQKYQEEEKKMRWLSLQGDTGDRMDLIESEDEESTLCQSPKSPVKNQSKI